MLNQLKANKKEIQKKVEGLKDFFLKENENETFEKASEKLKLKKELLQEWAYRFDNLEAVEIFEMFAIETEKELKIKFNV